MSDFKVLFEYLKCLNSKTENQSKHENLNLLLNSLTTDCLLLLRRNDDVVVTEIAPFLFDQSNDPIWTFVMLNSAIMMSLVLQLDARNDVINVTEQELILKSIQSIIRLAICPSLLNGVGVPLKAIAGTVPLNANGGSEPLNEIGDQVPLNFTTLHRRLVFATIVLIELSNHKLTNSIILSTHLIDLIAILTQLCYGPIKSSTSQSESTHLAPKTVQDCRRFLYFYANSRHVFNKEELILEMNGDRRVLIDRFEKLRRGIYQPLLVRDLLILQNFSSQNKSSPKWYRQKCGDFLTEILLRTNGVGHVVDAILTNISDYSEHDSKLETIGHVISQCPRQSNPDSYLPIISPQLLTLLNGKSKSACRISIFALSNLRKSNPDLAQKYAFDVILRPMVKLIDFKSIDKIDVIAENELNCCIQSMSKFLDCSPDIKSLLLPSILSPVFGQLFHIYCDIHRGTSNIRLLVENLLTSILEYSDNSLALLNESAFGGVEYKRGTIQFQCGENGGTKAVFDPELNFDLLDGIDSKTVCLSKLIFKRELSDLLCDWFFDLLNKLSQLINQSETEPQLDQSQIESNLILLTLIQKMAETDYTLLIRDIPKVVVFVSATLDRASHYGEAPFRHETLFLCLTILVLITSQQLSSSDWTILEKCVEPLRKLTSNLGRDQILINLSGQVLTSIATRGVATQALKKEESKLTRFEDAWLDLSDSSPAVKGHALIALKQLILDKNTEAMQKKDLLFDTFEEHLSHEDSYVYLTAIEAMSALGLKYSETILPKLLTKLAKLNERGEPNQIELRLKLGEAIVKISRNLGDVVPKYRDVLLNVFLRQTRDSDKEIQCSSFSNLGEICKLLRFSIGPNLQEILNCLEHASLRRSNPINVRRSAILVLCLMLRGLGRDALIVLKDEILFVYRLIKRIHNGENDDVAKLHCQLAMDEMNEIVTQFMKPDSNNMEKRIRILN